MRSNMEKTMVLAVLGLLCGGCSWLEEWMYGPEEYAVPMAPPPYMAYPQPAAPYYPQSPQLSALQAENQRLRKELEELRAENRSLKSDIGSLQTQQNALERERIRLQNELQAKGVGNLKVSVREGRLRITLPSKVFFPPGSATLLNESKATLAKVAQAIRTQFPNRRIQIEGHTDTDPIRHTKHLYKSNWELSTARALSVLHYLIEQGGIPPQMISVAGYGQYRPVAPNTTPADKQKNRRVEIVVMPALPSALGG